MKLSRIDVKNFRLLRAVSIRVGTDDPTILVGPNNSGKTAVAEALQIFTDPSRRAFAISDFSLVCREEFEKAEVEFLKEGPPGEPPRLPAMSIALVFDYEHEPPDLAVVADLLMDLDEGPRKVAVLVEFAPVDPAALGSAFRSEREAGQTLWDFLAGRLHEFYAFAHYKTDAVGGERERLPDAKALARLIRVDFIGAQRHIDDKEGGNATRLSRLLHAHYSSRYERDDPNGHKELESLLKRQSEELSGRYAKAFEGLTGALGLFGYPQKQAPRLSIKAEFDSATLFRDNTRVFYTAELPKRPGSDAIPTCDLPEKYNGLGFKNLIYMILQMRSFAEDLRRSEGARPRVHLVIIEEPEVHLHPQVQSVFIKHVAKLMAADGEYCGAQILVTTHSSHIVADCGFSPVRYFRRRGNSTAVKDLLGFADAPGEGGAETVRFLAQYLTQTRCDLFFSDKAILVEGPVERLLLPRMIAQVADGDRAGFASEYVSVLEVGGAYAHLFGPLLRFIEIPTLVITDIDAVGADRKKCPVAEGTGSSNATLTKWLPGKPDIGALRAASAADKTSGTVRVAYQTDEPAAGKCARSFEEAFLYANADWLAVNAASLAASGGALGGASAERLVANAYSIAAERLGKTDFALDLMLAGGWRAPAYIREGLEWLAEQPL